MSVLYVVATPIGNLEDMTYRAVSVLKQVDYIAAEDTRHSKKLLVHYGIDTPMLSYHEHNENESSAGLISLMAQGKSIALISDAGTPLIADPGYRLVQQAREQNLAVVPIPGCSAAVAALSVSGMSTDRFCFEGFLSAKAVARRNELEALTTETRTMVFYEAPHRVAETVSMMADVLGSGRRVILGREITKHYEQFWQGTLAAAISAFDEDQIVSRGEFVIIVSGNKEQSGLYDEEVLMRLLLTELPPRKAAKLAHKLTGASKKSLYEISLAQKDRPEVTDLVPDTLSDTRSETTPETTPDLNQDPKN